MNCKWCNKELVMTRSDKKFCNGLCRSKFNRYDNFALFLWKVTRARAIKENIPFNIDVNDIIIPDVCPIFKTPINKHHENGERKRSNNSPSLDRIIPELGYIKGNVWVVSDRANRLKSNLNEEDLRMFCNTLLNKLDEIKGKRL